MSYSEMHEVYQATGMERRALQAADARGERTEQEATKLVMEYMTNVAKLYAIPMITLLRRLDTEVLHDFGNG